ncbi:hypothetical protein JF536_00640 [Priestia flexa]|uniref:hypothetical protein n=1 Tax=Priestia flexa TaxID=86664 RepID=UPI001A8C13FB|nr:hypothetical protein [Priestia flexa]MBN8432599.1 hypothetical protein [Priestia flexa]MCA0965415.1 hypothetical protein [Priestia flexa]
MISFLLISISSIVLFFVLYYLPLPYNKNGRVAIFSASVILAIVGLITNVFLSIKGMLLTLLLLILCIAYLFSKRPALLMGAETSADEDDDYQLHVNAMTNHQSKLPSVPHDAESVHQDRNKDDFYLDIDTKQTVNSFETADLDVLLHQDSTSVEQKSEHDQFNVTSAEHIEPLQEIDEVNEDNALPVVLEEPFQQEETLAPLTTAELDMLLHEELSSIEQRNEEQQDHVPDVLEDEKLLEYLNHMNVNENEFPSERDSNHEGESHLHDLLNDITVEDDDFVVSEEVEELEDLISDMTILEEEVMPLENNHQEPLIELLEEQQLAGFEKEELHEALIEEIETNQLEVSELAEGVDNARKDGEESHDEEVHHEGMLTSEPETRRQEEHNDLEEVREEVMEESTVAEEQDSDELDIVTNLSEEHVDVVEEDQGASEKEQEISEESQEPKQAAVTASMNAALWQTILEQIEWCKYQQTKEQYEDTLHQYIHTALPAHEKYVLHRLLIQHYIDSHESQNATTQIEIVKEAYGQYPILLAELNYLHELANLEGVGVKK